MNPALKLMAPGDWTLDLDTISRHIFLRKEIIKPLFFYF